MFLLDLSCGGICFVYDFVNVRLATLDSLICILDASKVPLLNCADNDGFQLRYGLSKVLMFETLCRRTDKKCI